MACVGSSTGRMVQFQSRRANQRDSDSDATTSQLAANNVSVLHKKKLNSGGDAIYCSCSTDAGHLLLCEIQLLPTAARCAVRCDTPGVPQQTDSCMGPRPACLGRAAWRAFVSCELMPCH